MSTINASRKRIAADKVKRKPSSKLGITRLKDAPISPSFGPNSAPAKQPKDMESWNSDFTEWNSGAQKSTIRELSEKMQKENIDDINTAEALNKFDASKASDSERNFNAALGPLLGSPPASPGDKGWSWNAIGSGIQSFSKAISLLTDEDAGPTVLEEKIAETAQTRKDDYSVLGSGLDAINGIGKVALGMANVIDNAIEGGLHLVQSSGNAVKGGASAVKNKLVSPNKNNPARAEFVAPAAISPPTKLGGAPDRRSFDDSASKPVATRSKAANLNTSYLANLWESDFDSWEDSAPAPAAKAAATSSSAKADADASAAALAAASARERELQHELDAVRSHCTESKAQQEQLESTMAGMQADLEVAKKNCLKLRTANKRIQERYAAQSAESESVDLGDQLRAQMECLLQEKAKLASENARLKRENDSLQELLMHAVGSGSEEEYEGHSDGGGVGERERGDGEWCTDDDEPVRGPCAAAAAAAMDAEADFLADALLEDAVALHEGEQGAEAAGDEE